MSSLKVSIITVSYNSVRTIAETINSVLNQTYPDIEYIIIDGFSQDGTLKVIESFEGRISKIVSEPDNGLYDAINKGIRISTGDIVGILNADDFFYDNAVIQKVADAFARENIDAVFGDVQFVDPLKTSKVVRYYSSKRFNISKFRYGYMPAHPSFYVKRILFEELGYYKTDYKISADFELLMRFLLNNKISYRYLDFPFISMRTGGVSNRSIGSNFTLNKEIARACRENGIKTNYFFIYSKYFIKVFQFLSRKI